jgi:valyl-tRNA synthetase
LIETLETILRALHPLMPFITEEIWQRVGPMAGRTGETIMSQPWPSSMGRDSDAEAQMGWTQGVILGVRQIRGEMDIAPSKRFEVLLENASEADLARLHPTRHFIERLANLSGLRALVTNESAPESAVALLGEMRILVPMAGLIDVTAEIGRLEKRIAKIRQDLAKTEAKLANANFVANAPASVVEQEHGRIADFSRELTSLEVQLVRVKAL